MRRHNDLLIKAFLIQLCIKKYFMKTKAECKQFERWRSHLLKFRCRNSYKHSKIHTFLNYMQDTDPISTWLLRRRQKYTCMWEPRDTKWDSTVMSIQCPIVCRMWKNIPVSVYLYPHNAGNQNRKIQVMNELTRSSPKLYKYVYKSNLQRQCQTAKHPNGVTRCYREAK